MKATSIFEELEGRTVDGKFALLERLGGDADCGVFLTVRMGVQRAVIKLVRADTVDAKARQAQWEEAKKLSHPNLVQIFETGRFSIDGTDLAYVVMEHGEEVLSHVLQERPLDLDETRIVLASALSALTYLHAKGFVHGHVKPSNIMRASEAAKLSADNFLVSAGIPKRIQKPGTYDAPEVLNGELTPAADAWSIGVTLAEMMTRRLPTWDWSVSNEAVVPESLPRPYLNIVLDCLRVDPHQRCTIKEIKAYLADLSRQPASDRVPAADPSRSDARSDERGEERREERGDERPGHEDRIPVSAGRISLAPEPIAPEPTPAAPKVTRFEQKPTGKWDAVSSSAPGVPSERSLLDGVRTGPARWEEIESPAPLPELFTQYEEAESRRFRVMPFLLGALVLLAFTAVLLVRSGKLDLPWLQKIETATGIIQRSAQPQPPATPSEQTQSPTTTESQTSTPQQPPATPPAANPATTPANGGSTSETPSPTAQPQPTSEAQSPATPPKQAQTEPAPTEPAQTEPSKTEPAKTEHARTRPPKIEQPAATEPAGASPAPANSEGAIANQVMPYPSSSALSSMRRPVPVTVRVSVDSTGRVLNASYVSPGEGNYFARISRRAAQQWKFEPPRRNGRAQPSAWTLHFYFTRSKPEVTATRDE